MFENLLCLVNAYCLTWSATRLSFGHVISALNTILITTKFQSRALRLHCVLFPYNVTVSYFRVHVESPQVTLPWHFYFHFSSDFLKYIKISTPLAIVYRQSKKSILCYFIPLLTSMSMRRMSMRRMFIIYRDITTCTLSWRFEEAWFNLYVVLVVWQLNY